MPDRPSGADWDPVSAKVYGPTEAKEASGEAKDSQPTLVGSCRIKKVGLYSTIRTNQEQANSQSNQYLDVRTPTSGCPGAKLTSANFITHRGMRYEVVGIFSTDYRLGITRYQVNVSNDFNFSG